MKERIAIMTMEPLQTSRTCVDAGYNHCSDDGAGSVASNSDTSSASSTTERSEEQQREPVTLWLGSTTSGFRKLHDRSDAGLIRSRLLTKLGIEKGCSAAASFAAAVGRAEASRVVQHGQESAYNIALKGDHGRPDHCLESSTAIETLSTSPGVDCVVEKRVNPGSVSFDASVKVHPIPARSDYSKRMRCVMWTSNMEIQQNAARNSLEFAAEEWDVEKVVEDKDMIIYEGERVHPIHFVQDVQQE